MALPRKVAAVPPREILEAFMDAPKRRYRPRSRENLPPVDLKLSNLKDSIRLTMLYLAANEPRFPGGLSMLRDDNDKDTVRWRILTEKRRREGTIEVNGKRVYVLRSIEVEYYFDEQEQMLRRVTWLLNGEIHTRHPFEQIADPEGLPQELRIRLLLALEDMRRKVA